MIIAGKRIDWLDIAKALSIILVVLGHAGHASLDIYLGWFRIPLFFFLSSILFMPIIFLSMFITKYRMKNFLEVVGRYSIVIMYLHLPVNIFFRTLLNYDVTTFEFTFFGVVIPVMIGYLLTSNGITKKLLLGQNVKTPKTAG